MLESTAARRVSWVWIPGRAQQCSALSCLWYVKNKRLLHYLLTAHCYVARANIPLAWCDDEIFYWWNYLSTSVSLASEGARVPKCDAHRTYSLNAQRKLDLRLCMLFWVSVVSVTKGIQLSPSSLRLVFGQLEVKIIRVYIWGDSFIFLPGKPQNLTCVCCTLNTKSSSQGGSQLVVFANGGCLYLVFYRKAIELLRRIFFLFENSCAIFFRFPAFHSEGLIY